MADHRHLRNANLSRKIKIAVLLRAIMYNAQEDEEDEVEYTSDLWVDNTQVSSFDHTEYSLTFLTLKKKVTLEEIPQSLSKISGNEE